jgi:two-component system chemotaxis response regulator CheY
MKTRKRILIADDADHQRHAVREILEREDFEVIGEARNGHEAVHLFLSQRPDMVLLDLVMPEGPGLTALREIRRHCDETPVVVCSGLGQERLAAEAVMSGANDFVVKPFHPFHLLAALWRNAPKDLAPREEALATALVA